MYKFFRKLKMNLFENFKLKASLLAYFRKFSRLDKKQSQVFIVCPIFQGFRTIIYQISWFFQIFLRLAASEINTLQSKSLVNLNKT